MLVIFPFFYTFVVAIDRGDGWSIFQVWDFSFFTDSIAEIFVLIFWELLVLNFSGLEKQGLEVRI